MTGRRETFPDQNLPPRLVSRWCPLTAEPAFATLISAEERRVVTGEALMQIKKFGDLDSFHDAQCR
jgi:hypothetical protein